MSKKALNALINAAAIMKAAGVDVNPLVEFLNDGKSRRGYDKKLLWRNSELLASLIVNSAANAFQTETAETLKDNGYENMADAVHGYIASNLDDWSQSEWQDCSGNGLNENMDRLVEMVNAHIEYNRRQELIAPINKQIGINNKRLVETENDNERIYLSNINMGLREMIKRLNGESPDYRIMPGEEVQHADQASVCNLCACLIANDDASGFVGTDKIEENARRGVIAWANEWNTLSIDHDKTERDTSFKCECCGVPQHGEKFHLVLANFRN